MLRQADVILSLDWLDPAGTLKLAGRVEAKVIQASLDYQLHNGWGMEHQALPALDIHLACTPDRATHAIADALGVGAGDAPADLPVCPALEAPAPDTSLDIMTLAGALGEGLEGVCASFVRWPLGWAGEAWHFRHPLDFLGSDGGAGIGSGPGMLVGAALVLFSASILVPLPATNTVPGFAVVVVAMGLLQRDGILVLIGAVLGTAWIATLIFAGATLVSLIRGWIGL